MAAQGGQQQKFAIFYRDIHPEDVPRVDELQRQLFPVRYSEGFYQRLFTDGHYTVLAVTADGAIVGIASARTVMDEPVGLRPESTREGYIMTLGVHESYRRYGIGNELLRRILAMLRSLSCSVAALHVKSLNVAAYRFYEHNGFRPDPEGGWFPGHYLIDGVQYDAYRLVCPLSASWVSWLATKLGLQHSEAPSGGAPVVRWPSARANAPRAAASHASSGGQPQRGRADGTAARTVGGYHLCAPWQ